jgi:uncharacterized protein VirK/YbjX
VWRSSSELFKLVDDQAGGRVQTFKRKLKFKLRYTWFRRQLQLVNHYANGHDLNPIIQADPSLYMKCTRSYLSNGLSGKHRVMMQLSFYDWLLSHFPPQFVRHFYASSSIKISTLPINDSVIDVHIQPARGLGREGEFALMLQLNAQVIMKASFTVLPVEMLGIAGHGHVMYVGGFQGQKNTRELVKEATQLMERTKPNAIVLNALQAIADTWGLVGIVGTSNTTHAYAGYRRSLAKRVGLDYDALWQELGAQEQTKLNHWVLPLTWQPRPDHEVESKKRSAHRRRNIFRQHFIDLCIGGVKRLSAIE